MKSRFISFIGRLLIIPVVMSNVCLSLIVGIPMTHAMEPVQTLTDTRLSSHQTHQLPTVETQTQNEEPGCCTRVQMQHDTKAIVPDQDKTVIDPIIATVLREVIPGYISSLQPPEIFLDRYTPHQPFSLTGIIIKRE